MLKRISIVMVLGMLGSISLGASALTATLAWKMPTERVDNTPMAETEIAGYEIRYRKKEAAVSTEKLVKLSGPRNLRTIVKDVDTSYTFCVAAVDVIGLYSECAVFPDPIRNPPMAPDVKSNPISFTP